MALTVALVLLAVLTVLGVTLGSGSSLRGGAGDNTYAPANVSAVQSHYRLGAGNLDLNLAAVKFPSAGKTVDVTVGLGKLTVEVPKNTVINLQARSGLGQVDVFGRTASNVQETYYIGTATSTRSPPEPQCARRDWFHSDFPGLSNSSPRWTTPRRGALVGCTYRRNTAKDRYRLGSAVEKCSSAPRSGGGLIAFVYVYVCVCVWSAETRAPTQTGVHFGDLVARRCCTTTLLATG